MVLQSYSGNFYVHGYRSNRGPNTEIFLLLFLRKCIGLSYLYLLSLPGYVLYIVHIIPTYMSYIIYFYKKLLTILALDFILLASFNFWIILNIFESLMIALTFPIFWFFVSVYHAGTSKIGSKTQRILLHTPTSRKTQKLISLQDTILSFTISWYTFSFYQLFNRPFFSLVQIIQMVTTTVCDALSPIIKAVITTIKQLPPEPPNFFFFDFSVRLLTVVCTPSHTYSLYFDSLHGIFYTLFYSSFHQIG